MLTSVSVYGRRDEKIQRIHNIQENALLHCPPFIPANDLHDFASLLTSSFPLFSVYKKKKYSRIVVSYSFLSPQFPRLPLKKNLE